MRRGADPTRFRGCDHPPLRRQAPIPPDATPARLEARAEVGCGCGWGLRSRLQLGDSVRRKCVRVGLETGVVTAAAARPLAPHATRRSADRLGWRRGQRSSPGQPVGPVDSSAPQSGSAAQSRRLSGRTGSMFMCRIGVSDGWMQLSSSSVRANAIYS